MVKPPTWILVPLGLAGGFATARATRRRRLGGAVWAASGALCLPSWHKAGVLRASVLAGAYVGAMGASHPLAKRVGPWPSVSLVTAGTMALDRALCNSRTKLARSPTAVTP